MANQHTNLKKRNKHWEREKEFFRLTKELSFYRNLNYIVSSDYDTDKISFIFDKLNSNFYYKFNNYNKAPKYFRKFLNKKRRKRSKSTLKKQLMGYDVSYYDNYKDANYLYY